MSLWERLSVFPAFERFDKFELRKVAQHVGTVSVKRRKYLQIKWPSPHVFFVLSGGLHLVHPDQCGVREIVLLEFNAGGIFGTSDVFGKEHPLSNLSIANTLSVRAVKDSEIAVMRSKNFERLATLRPDLTLWLSGKLGDSNRQLLERLVELALLSMRSRLCLYLVRTAKKEDTVRFEFSVPSHEVIGAQIYSSREAVTREMVELKRQGILNYSRGRIQITDWNALCRLCPDNVAPNSAEDFSEHKMTLQNRM